MYRLRHPRRPDQKPVMSLSPPITNDDRMQGDNTATMSLLEFGDYECSFCAVAHQTVKALQAEFGGRLRFVFRNFPLVEMHPNALAAALVAEAADPDQFWQLHNLIYANSGNLSRESLLAYAREAGVAEATALAALNGATLDKVQRDLDSGTLSGVQGTPAFFVNGRLHEGEWRGEALAHALLETSNAD